MFKRKVRFLKREREKYEERSEREKKSYFFFFVLVPVSNTRKDQHSRF